MDKLVGEQLRVGILDANKLGAYYRLFYMITQFLIRKNQISAAEQSCAFIRGFQSDLWNQIQRRLELKFPDHYPDDSYTLAKIHEAVQYVFHGTTHTNLLQCSSASNNASTTTTSSTATSNIGIKSEDLTTFLDKFAQMLIKALVPSNPPAHTHNHQQPHTHSYNSSNNNSSTDPRQCIFCGLTDHLIKECLVCQQYIANGKCKRNAEGKG